MNISIVTGTLNRAHLLPDLIYNTIDSDDRLELVLVDGGSTDGTIDYINNLQHPKIKFIEYGKRSYYPHYMNLGIKNASYELICQWNDDSLLLNKWDDVFNEIDDIHGGYLFSWQNGVPYNPPYYWNLHNEAHLGREIVINYGIYKKDVFRKCGLYNMKYKYYCADGEMALRAYCLGVKFKNLYNIKVCVLPVEKTAIHDNETMDLYYRSIPEYHNNNIDKEVEYLQ